MAGTHREVRSRAPADNQWNSLDLQRKREQRTFEGNEIGAPAIAANASDIEDGTQHSR